MFDVYGNILHPSYSDYHIFLLVEQKTDYDANREICFSGLQGICKLIYSMHMLHQFTFVFSCGLLYRALEWKISFCSFFSSVEYSDSERGQRCSF